MVAGRELGSCPCGIRAPWCDSEPHAVTLVVTYPQGCLWVPPPLGRAALGPPVRALPDCPAPACGLRGSPHALSRQLGELRLEVAPKGGAEVTKSRPSVGRVSALHSREYWLAERRIWSGRPVETSIKVGNRCLADRCREAVIQGPNSALTVFAF